MKSYPFNLFLILHMSGQFISKERVTYITPESRNINIKNSSEIFEINYEDNIKSSITTKNKIIPIFSESNNYNNNTRITDTLTNISTTGNITIKKIKKNDTKRIRPDSSYGPFSFGSKKAKIQFIIVILIMTFCGSNNDFLGKLCYQSLPGNFNGINGIINGIWIAWFLTFGTFLICTFSIFLSNDLYMSIKNYNINSFKETIIPALFDVYVNIGRYISLVFLPASVVTLLKNGYQLIFSGILRRIWEHKRMIKSQIIGILITIVGLLIVSIQVIIQNIKYNENSFKNTKYIILNILIGVFIVLTVGLCGSIRNHFEQKLCYKYPVNFVVGIRSFISLIIIVFIGLILLQINYKYIKNDQDWYHIIDGIKFISQKNNNIFWLVFTLFLIAIYGKNITQMIIIKLSNAVTRNLMTQFMPIGTWIMSLIFYSINDNFGEKFYLIQFIRLIGFVLVLIGAYLYMKPPNLIQTKRVTLPQSGVIPSQTSISTQQIISHNNFNYTLQN